MRPIDADNLKSLIKQYMKDFKKSETRLVACRAVLSMIGDKNQTPTIDAVPVVQCKDCKYLLNEMFEKLCACDGFSVKDEHFCSYGERRDDE